MPIEKYLFLTSVCLREAYLEIREPSEPDPPKFDPACASPGLFFFQIKAICIEISARPPEKSIGICHSEKKFDPACASQVELFKFDLVAY